MLNERSSGVLLHPTSLPGPYGVGAIGAAARRFVEALARAKQRWWQLLPLNPTGSGASPYSATSSFANNPLMIDLDDLIELDLLEAGEVRPLNGLPADRVAFHKLIPAKELVLALAADRLVARKSGPLAEAFKAFKARHDETWLDDFAVWEALSIAHDRAHWRDWPEPLRRRDPAALKAYRHEAKSAIARAKALQFLFDRQWSGLRAAAVRAGVRFIGDMPIFVSDNSADVWARPHLFKLDEDGRQTALAGCPPDYFNAEGQLWGNPLYAWPAHEAEDFAWWTARMRRLLEVVDGVRIDHFRGFAACWEIPAGAETAKEGAWAPAPGHALFAALKAQLGDLPVIAEDLGTITPDVIELRDAFDFPGLRILQYEFGSGVPQGEADPRNYPRNSVVYPGTHDNNTIVGWFRNEGYDAQTRALTFEAEAAAALALMGGDGSDIAWRMIELALASGSALAIVQMQDILEFDGGARMNTPGTIHGNWGWRCPPEAIETADWDRLADLARRHGRAVVAAEPAV